jgi:hypothetical protein
MRLDSNVTQTRKYVIRSGAKVNPSTRSAVREIYAHHTEFKFDIIFPSEEYEKG